MDRLSNDRPQAAEDLHAGRETATEAQATKRVLIKTFGCQMNVYDSERMAEVLAPMGYASTETLDDADLVILNTCHIREKAAEKVYSDLGRIRQVKAKRREGGQETVVAVAGCVAQAEGKEIAARAPVVDFVVGPQSYHRLPDLIGRLNSGERRIVETEFPEDDKFSALPDRDAAPRVNGAAPRAVTAFLTVQEGCDKFCTFCVVPYTRGVEYSRPAADLIKEAEKLVKRGVRELTLLGQNVNAYHGAGPDGRIWSLADLLRALAGIEGLARLRYTTSHPRDMSDDLIEVHGDLEKVMPYLHLPVQSGSDRILAAMNRKHKADEYRQLIRRVRAARPNLALSTDIIVGFPGETESDFEATLRLVEEIGFAQAFSFKYSPRPGTPAATLELVVAEDVKTERLHRLQELVERQQKAFNESMIGQTVPVLIDRVDFKNGVIVGRSPWLQLVRAGVPSQVLGQALGQIVPIEITAAALNSLTGVITGVMSPA